MISRLVKVAARKASRSIYTQNRRLERRFNGEEWMHVLLECQAKVSETAPLYYRSEYMVGEKCWWFNIPKWVWGARGSGAVRIADFAAGYGTLALFCRRAHPHAQISCFDLKPENMAPGLESDGITCKRADIYSLDTGEEYDIALFTEVLEHLDFHPSVALSRIHDMLKPGGVLYMSTPDAEEWGQVTKYYRHFEDMPSSPGQERIDDHVYQYSRDEIVRLVKESGLSVLEWEYAPGVVSRHFNLALTRPEKS